MRTQKHRATVDDSREERIRRVHEIARKILRSKPATQKLLLDTAPTSVIKHICNLCNIACKCDSTKYTNTQLKRIKPHYKKIKVLISPRRPLAEKRKILQKGGFLPILAAVLGPVIGGLISSITGKRD